MFESISGHKKQLELLEKAMKKGKLAHAYVFAGPDGVGKKSIAQRLAFAMLEENSPSLSLRDISPKGGEKFESYFHPDLMVVERREDKNEIVIEQIRELVYKLALMPYQARYKVAIIDKAEQMNDEAANALLKTLEEPKDYTYIFLITGNSQRLPKTILSRTQKITFGPIDTPEENTEELQALKSSYEIFLSAKLSDRLITAYDMADLETDEIKKMFDYWLKKLQQNLQTQASRPLANKISRVMLARKFLEQNVNTKLLLTNLMLSSS